MKTEDLSSWNKTDMPKMNKKHYNMSPSKVIHCREIAESCHETDLVQVLKVFGSIKAIKLMPRISQALIEFEELDSAIACTTYNRIQPIHVQGYQIYVNYSKSAEISRDFKISQGQVPTKILLITIINVIHQINVETIKKICGQQNINPIRIVIFHKNGLQVLVEFKSVEDASLIQQSLNGCDIYPGCCTLKIEFSKTEKLNVHSNTAESYNADLNENELNSTYLPGQKKEKLDSEISTLLKGYQEYPEVQKIITRVLALNQSQSHNSSIFNGMHGRNITSDKMIIDPTKNGTSLLQHSVMAAQSQKVEQLIGPFSAMTTGSNLIGGEGCVALVYGINNERINCDHLFNLFCLYGSVMKVKILVNKPGCAMVQYNDRLATEIAMQHMNNITIFGQQLQIRFSKHPHIVESHIQSTVFDGTPSFVSYSDSRNNRFRFVAGGKNDFASRIHPVSKVLHYFNAPPDCSVMCLEQLFTSKKTEAPVKQASISRPNGKSSSGVLEFSSVSAAVEALMLVNHVTLHAKDSKTDGDVVIEKPGAPFTVKLAFSTSDAVRLG